MDTWTHGHTDTWTHGHMDTWTHGHMDTWTKPTHTKAKQDLATPTASSRTPYKKSLIPQPPPKLNSPPAEQKQVGALRLRRLIAGIPATICATGRAKLLAPNVRGEG